MNDEAPLPEPTPPLSGSTPPPVAPAAAPPPPFVAPAAATPPPPFAAPAAPSPAPSPPTVWAQSAPPAFEPPTNARPLNVLAVISLVSAFFVSVAAIVTGHIALSQLKRRAAEGRPENGRGLALAGVIVGYAGVAVSIAALCTVLVISITGGFRALPGVAALAPAPDLTFEAGSTLDPSSTAAFTDDFAHQPGFTESKKDWGDGNFQYTSSDGKCTVDFTKTSLGSVQIAKGDDKQTSDNLLAMLLNASYSDVATYADNAALIQNSLYSSSTVDARAMGWSQDNGTQGEVVARAFTALDYGLSVQTICADDASMQAALGDVSASAVIAVK